MRTTITLEKDIADQLAKVTKETDQPFKVVVNMVLRKGLADLAPAIAPFEFQPHAGGLLPGIDDRRLNELAWSAEDEQFR